MSMTQSRRNVYRRKWWSRECKVDMKMRRKEINRRARHAPVTEDSCNRGYDRMLRTKMWDTMS